MTSPRRNLVILAAAGSRKTQRIIEQALSSKTDRTLITTYTNENKRQIEKRIIEREGLIPQNITILTWFTFLLHHLAKPYQVALTNEAFKISGINFTSKPGRFTKKSNLNYFLDRKGSLYKDRVADFAIEVNNRVKGSNISRLESIFSKILIDEVQDLVGYDLEVLDLLLSSGIHLTAVGDPRQHILSTNRANKNKSFRGIGFLKWLKKREDICRVEQKNISHRCNQTICDFSDLLFPELPRTKSLATEATSHDGVFILTEGEVKQYLQDFPETQVLRRNIQNRCGGFPAINIGVAKGSTYERVLIFPTKPMKKFLLDTQTEKFKERERLYVAVTRARHSVAFVVDRSAKQGLLNTGRYKVFSNSQLNIF